MQIECPQCGQKMIVYIGLRDPDDSPIECLGCHNTIVPLLPGPIVDGPFID
jgi:ribosomal protein S27E